MAVRKFILVAGQSNATEIGEAQGWEDQNPYLAIRSPQHEASQTPQFSNGAYNDLLTLPYTFNGGQQTDFKGDGTAASQWQYSNVIGSASQAIRYLTFYDPTATYLNGGVWLSTYPGTGTILAGSTSTSLTTSVRWQDDPSNIVLTRQRTGQQHTIDTTTADTSTVGITPPMVPPPEVGELFDYEIETTGSSTTTELVFKNQFGGVIFTTLAETYGVSSSIGSTDGEYASYVSQIRNADGTKDSARVTCRGRFVKVGDVIQFTNNTSGTVANITGIVDSATSADPYYVTRVLTEGETVSVAAAGWDHGDNQIRVSAHKLAHLEPIKFSTPGTGDALPPELDEDTTYYVNNQISVAVANWGSGGATASNSSVNITDHGLSNDDIVVFSNNSGLPTDDGGTAATAYQPAVDTPYYVGDVTSDAFRLYVDSGLTQQLTWDTAPASDATITLPNIFRLQSGIVTGSPAAVTFESGGGTCTVTRLDSYANFYISASVGGDEIQADADSGRDDTSIALPFGTGTVDVPFYKELKLQHADVFRGSLTGLQARCIKSVNSSTAGNVGVAKALADVKLSSSNGVVTCDAWDNQPYAGDTFVIEPTGQAADFHKWAMWLPWCPFEGKASYVGPGLTTISSPSNGNPVLVTVGGLLSAIQVGSKIRFYTSGNLPSPLVEGRDYFVHTVAGTSDIYIKETYNSTTPIAGDGGTGLGVHTLYIVDAEGKANPYPPGFNYPNHHAIPRAYQPFDGSSFINRPPSIGFHTGLAYRLHEHYGEVMNVAVSAIGGTSVGHKEVWDVDTGVQLGHAWLDVMQQKSWSPGEPNNCFARLEDVLDAAKTAFTADGDTGECVGIFWVQGESDAGNQRLANNYENATRKLRAAIRKAVKSRGLTTLDEDKIPFVHPKIKEITNWAYATTVNTAIQTLADEDPYSRTFSVADLELNAADGVHYTGKGMNDLGDLCYTAWKNIQRSGSSEVDICNLALTHIGDKATITSINPSDGSHQADLCARYYPLARDLLLERHRWDFTIRQVSPVALSASGRTDWEYAYRLPSNFAGVIAVLAKDSTDDQISEGTAAPQPFAIESNIDQDRVLYCNLKDVVLRYQAKITDSTKFSQMFVHAISWQLASMLAGALIKGDDGAAAVQNATRMAEFYAERAAAFDSRTTRDKPVVDTNTNPWDR